MKISIKKLSLLFGLAVLLILALAVPAYANISVGYKIESTYDTDAILYEGTISLPDDSTVFDGLQKICNDNTYTLEYNGTGENLYVSKIGDQAHMRYTPNSSYYSGWMYRVNDTMIDYSCDDPTYAVLSNGDKVTWYYACPEYTYYTKVNSTSVNGTTLTVNVKADIFTDVMAWERSGFQDRQGAAVKIKKGSTEYSATTNSSGVATFSSLGSGTWTVWVEPLYYTSAPANCLKHTKSWETSATI